MNNAELLNYLDVLETQRKHYSRMGTEAWDHGSDLGRRQARYFEGKASALREVIRELRQHTA